MNNKVTKIIIYGICIITYIASLHVSKIINPNAHIFAVLSCIILVAFGLYLGGNEYEKRRI